MFHGTEKRTLRQNSRRAQAIERCRSSKYQPLLLCYERIEDASVLAPTARRPRPTLTTLSQSQRRGWEPTSSK